MAIYERVGGRTATLPPESLEAVGERAVLDSEVVTSADADTDIFASLSANTSRTLTTHPDAHQARSSRTQEPGDRCGEVLHGRYRLLRQLGRGGMGTVYLAEHTSIPKTFAIKVLNSRYASREDIAARFLLEAKAVSLIEHPNVVGVVDFGTAADGSTFLVMEHLRGASLKTLCKEAAPLPWARLCHIMKQLCGALSAAHDLGIVHRDIKPDNILRTTFGDDEDCIKVLDFGLAKIQASGGLRLTRTGMVLGTPEYMAPEQARGAPIDHRVDIYAAGILYYELLCGRTPFKAKNFIGMRNQHLLAPPESPSKWAPEAGITDEMDAIALRALAKDPEHRFASIAEMAEAIAHVGTGRGPVALSELATEPGLAAASLLATSGRLGRVSTLPPHSEGSRSMSWRGGPSALDPKLAPPAHQGRGGLLAALGVGLCLALGGIWVAFIRPSVEAPAATRAPSAGPPGEAGAPAGAAPLDDPATDPAGALRDEPSTSPPGTVAVTFEINVDGAMVYEALDQALVGRVEAGAMILEFPRGDAAQRLTLRAPGYRELVFELTPSEDQTLQFELQPDPNAAPAPGPRPR